MSFELALRRISGMLGDVFDLVERVAEMFLDFSQLFAGQRMDDHEIVGFDIGFRGFEMKHVFPRLNPNQDHFIHFPLLRP